jgi:segregation and condensation protein A
MSTAYHVELELFSGPLDLLLYLVRRHEVPIVDLPIAAITAQFQQYLDVLEFIDIDFVGDFVVMASTLVEIKSRQVLPRPEELPETEIAEDPRSELIRQLLKYKKFKDAALALEERAAQWQERYPRLSDERPTQEKELAADFIKDVELWDLISALGRVIQKKAIEQQQSIRHDETPIGVYVDRIGERVRQEGRVPFSVFFEGANHRSKIVGIFLAVLELLRHYSFRAEQPVEYGEIWILPPMEAEADKSAAPVDQTASTDNNTTE